MIQEVHTNDAPGAVGPFSQAIKVGNLLFVSGQLPIDPATSSIYLDKPPIPYGGGGLVSTARDYDRFLLMLANLGQVDGRRIISEAAVRQGTGNLLPAGVAGPAMMSPASEFGAGGRVGVGPEAGIYGWAGAAGT